MSKQIRTEKHEEARNSVPDKLKPVFDHFVEDYIFACQMRYGKRFVSYVVLADLVKAGWRRSEEEVK
ncbi:MAG: hypothetical protein U9N55_09015 [candidate division Zixibacteria bacterium]|nr:hypothetical protein [candidate division Zixibacteria bacterium]